MSKKAAKRKSKKGKKLRLEKIIGVPLAEVAGLDI